MKNWILQCRLYDLQNKENEDESINFYKLISNESGLWFLKSDKKGGLVENRFKRKLFSKILAISFDGKNFIKMGKKTK